MAERDRAAIRVDVLGVVGQGRGRAAPRDPATAKASFSSITSMSDRAAGPACASSFCGRRRRADAHDARRDARGRRRNDARARRQPVPLRRLLGGQDQRRRAVIDAGGIARRDAAAVRAERRLQLGERFERGVARGCSSVSTRRCRPCCCGMVTGAISRSKKPLSCACRARCWRAQRKGILILAADLIVLRRRSPPSPAWNRRRTAPSSAG